MNILPFITIFLIVLSLFSYFSIQQCKKTLTEETSKIGYMNAERKARQSLNYQVFAKVPKKKTEESLAKDSSQESDKEKKASYFSRESPKLKPKINLYPLIIADDTDTLRRDMKMQTILEKICVYLYSYANIFESKDPKDTFKSLITNLIENGHELLDEKNEDLSFYQLYPSSPYLQRTYYKLLKGTQEYNTQMQIGYPPFSDYFTLTKSKERKMIPFGSLNKHMLIAVFDLGLAEKILEKEAALRLADPKRTTLTEAELKELCHKEAPNQNLDQLIEYLDFSKSKHKKDSQVISFDEHTKIKVEKNI